MKFINPSENFGKYIYSIQTQRVLLPQKNQHTPIKNFANLCDQQRQLAKVELSQLICTDEHIEIVAEGKLVMRNCCTYTHTLDKVKLS